MDAGERETESELELERDRWGSEQRTELAWSRSGLAVLACVILLGRRLTSLFKSPRTQVFALAIAVVIVAIGGLFALAWRGNKERDISERLRLVALGTGALAAVAFVLGLFPAN